MATQKQMAAFKEDWQHIRNRVKWGRNFSYTGGEMGRYGIGIRKKENELQAVDDFQKLIAKVPISPTKGGLMDAMDRLEKLVMPKIINRHYPKDVWG